MTDNEILLSLSNMLDPIRDEIHDIKGDIRDMRSDICEIRNDISDMKSDIYDMKQDICDLKDHMQSMENDICDIKTRTTKIELTQENVILPRLRTIESCYTSTYDKYKDNIEEHETMRQDISVLKQVVSEHSAKLQQITVLTYNKSHN